MIERKQKRNLLVKEATFNNTTFRNTQNWCEIYSTFTLLSVSYLSSVNIMRSSSQSLE